MFPTIPAEILGSRRLHRHRSTKFHRQPHPQTRVLGRIRHPSANLPRRLTTPLLLRVRLPRYPRRIKRTTTRGSLPAARRKRSTNCFRSRPSPWNLLAITSLATAGGYCQGTGTDSRNTRPKRNPSMRLCVLVHPSNHRTYVVGPMGKAFQTLESSRLGVTGSNLLTSYSH